VLVVCHLGVIKSLVYSVAGRRYLPDEPALLEKKAMHHLHYSSGRYHLGPLNIIVKDDAP
jgi:probable phosphoglycerate mutase